MMNSGFWNKKPKPELNYVLRIAFLVGLGGFVYGYCLGVVHNFLPRSWTDFFIQGNSCGWMFFHVIGTAWGLVPGALITSSTKQQGLTTTTADSLFFATLYCPFFIIGALFLTFLIICVVPYGIIHGLGTFILGVPTGFTFVGSTVYLAEISPTRIRGAIVATFFLQIAAGQIVYYLISLTSLYFNYSYIHEDDDERRLDQWQWMLGIVPVYFIFELKDWLPEYSPNCLCALGKKKKAIEILRKTRSSTDDVVREVEALKLAVKNVDWKNLPFCSKNMNAGIACLMAEHLVGMNMVMHYTPRIVVYVLQLHQYSSSDKYLISVTFLIKSVLSAIGTLLCIAFVDRYGRRRLLLFGTFGIITCLGFLSFVLYGHSLEVVTAHSCTITGNGGMRNNILGLLALGALGFYFIFYSMGIGTIPWIMNTEIIPLGVRLCFGMTASLIYWFSKGYVNMFYIYLGDVIGQFNIGKPFLILCLFSCMACCIVYVFAVETNGYPIEEVEKLLLLEKKILYDARQRQVIRTSRNDIPYMFSSSSDDDE